MTQFQTRTLLSLIFFSVFTMTTCNKAEEPADSIGSPANDG
jgi:hypothetical protein